MAKCDFCASEATSSKKVTVTMGDNSKEVFTVSACDNHTAKQVKKLEDWQEWSDLPVGGTK